MDSLSTKVFILFLFFANILLAQQKADDVSVECNGGSLEIKNTNILQLNQALPKTDDLNLGEMTQLLVAAEKEPERNKTLSIEVINDNGQGIVPLLIFSQQKEELTIKVYDVEGFEMTINSGIVVEKGFNLYAMNVKALAVGTYVVRVRGKEIDLHQNFKVAEQRDLLENLTLEDKEIQRVDFMGSSMKIDSSNILKIVQKRNVENSDDAVNNVLQALLESEDEPKVLEINFTASNESVSDFFIFRIESENEKQLFLEIYNEEGFEIVSNLEFSVNAGNNIMALDIIELKQGTYYFSLKDKENSVFRREIKIER